MTDLDAKALEAAHKAIWGTESVEGRIATLGYSTAKIVAEQAVRAYLQALPPQSTLGETGEPTGSLTMWAEVVETYEGDGVEWRCSEEGGRDPDERPVIELAASTFPLGTKIEIREPGEPE